MDGVLDAPLLEPCLVEKNDQNVCATEEKACATCKIPLSRHSGKCGSVKCLGEAFSNGFNTLLGAITTIRQELADERSAALDREVRLAGKIKELSFALAKERDAVDNLTEIVRELEEKSTLNVQRSQTSTMSRKKTKRPKRNAAAAAAVTIDSDKQSSGDESSTSHWEENMDGCREGREGAISQRTNTKVGTQGTCDDRTNVSVSVRDVPKCSNVPVSVREDARKRRSPTPVQPALPEMDSGDDSWQLVATAKPKKKFSVLYVGNLSEDITEEKLRKFLSHRSRSVQIPEPLVHECKIFAKKEGSSTGSCGARVCVDDASAGTITSLSFWPRQWPRIYARPWTFRAAASADLKVNPSPEQANNAQVSSDETNTSPTGDSLSC